MSFTEKEKEIINKGLKIYREEKEKSMNEFYERIEKELEVSKKKKKNIQVRVIKLAKQFEEYQPLKYVGVIVALMIPVFQHIKLNMDI